MDKKYGIFFRLLMNPAICECMLKNGRKLFDTVFMKIKKKTFSLKDVFLYILYSFSEPDRPLKTICLIRFKRALLSHNKQLQKLWEIVPKRMFKNNCLKCISLRCCFYFFFSDINAVELRPRNIGMEVTYYDVYTFNYSPGKCEYSSGNSTLFGTTFLFHIKSICLISIIVSRYINSFST